MITKIKDSMHLCIKELWERKVWLGRLISRCLSKGWMNRPRLKVIFTLWLHVKNRLLTTDRLLKWRIQVDHICVMCYQEEETIDQFFFEDMFASILWRRLLQRINKPPSSTISTRYQWIILKTKERSQQGQALKLICTKYRCNIEGEEHKRETWDHNWG